MMKKKKIIVVLGPTGSGKSDLALKLAKKFNGYLISADSRQVYKGMDIGTNKDPVVCRGANCYWQGIEECLINIRKPSEQFTLSDWLSLTKKVIQKRKNKLPIIVGGTGLYISALVNGYELPGEFDAELRAKLEKDLAKKGLDYILAKLKKLDLDIEQKIDTANPRRVVRALEICQNTGQPFNRKAGKSEFEFLQIGINVDREKLYKKLDERAEKQIMSGLIEETEKLLKKGYQPDLSALSGIGYRQVVRFLNSEIDLGEAIELNKRDNRRYAKRQMTWFRRDKSIKWIRNYNAAEKMINKFLKLNT